jgi:hypothetical protein
MQNLTSGNLYVLSKAIMQSFRGEQADTCMSMLLVIPREEILAETPGIFDTAEALWEVRTVLKGLKLGL